MESLAQILSLAIIQGITEFLPVSSSAHLILVPIVTGWEDQGLAFDIAVHIGTLIAVCAYFRAHIQRLIFGFYRSIIGRPSRFYSPLAWQIAIACIPISIIGLLAHDFVATHLRAPIVIGCATIVFGLMLLASDYWGTQKKSMHKLGLKHAILIGLAQTMALIPGTSRSGITMTAGLALGFNRRTAATFSFLLSVPVILLAGGYEGYKIFTSAEPIEWSAIGTGVSVAALSAYVCIHFFFKLLAKIGMLPFVVYRLLLGSFLLFIFL